MIDATFKVLSVQPYHRPRTGRVLRVDLECTGGELEGLILSSWVHGGNLYTRQGIDAATRLEQEVGDPS